METGAEEEGKGAPDDDVGDAAAAAVMVDDVRVGAVGGLGDDINGACGMLAGCKGGEDGEMRSSGGMIECSGETFLSVIEARIDDRDKNLVSSTCKSLKTFSASPPAKTKTVDRKDIESSDGGSDVSCPSSVVVMTTSAECPARAEGRMPEPVGVHHCSVLRSKR